MSPLKLSLSLFSTPPAKGPAPPLQKRSENSPEHMAREMERDVNTTLEESAAQNASGNLLGALEKGKHSAQG